jgi:hypothetical protein
MKYKHTPFPALLLLLLTASIATFSANVSLSATAPHLDIMKTTGEITIDGDLGDTGWIGAAMATGFLEHSPGDQSLPAVKTVARITYDDQNLYVSCICFDEPEEVRATYCDRDHLRGNDVIMVLLDPFAEANRAYVLYVNPFGVQTDAMWSSSGEDYDYDIMYESAGRITTSGYQVEVAIPFASLRYPAGSHQTWKFNINRIRPRESWYEYSWAPFDRNNPCEPCQWGTISGLENVRRSWGLEFIPSIMGYQRGIAIGDDASVDPTRFYNQDPEGEAALNVRFKPVSNVSLEAAFNPDYSQIEPDAGQLDLGTTSALFYPERRPFFQEASDLFSTLGSAYYSRMINDPQTTVKATGRIGRLDFGYILAKDEHSPFILPFRNTSIQLLGGRSVANVLRLRQTISQDTHVALMLTDRRMQRGGAGRMLDLDGQLRLHNNWRFQFQTMRSWIDEPDDADLSSEIENYIQQGWIDSTFGDASYTAVFDGESFSGHYLLLNMEERSRHFDCDLLYMEINPTYRSDLGFNTTNNWRGFEIAGTYKLYYDNSWLEKLQPRFLTSNGWHFEGRKRWTRHDLGLSARMAGQLDLSVTATTRSELFRRIWFNDIWAVSTRVSKYLSEQVYLRTSVDYGNQISRSDLVLGEQTSLEFYAYLRPHDRVLIEPDYSFIQSTSTETGDQLWAGYIFRTKMNYFFSRQFNIRLVVQYNDIYRTLNIDPLLTYRLNAFTVFYVGASSEYCDWPGGDDGLMNRSPYLNRRQFFAKLQYLVRL